MKLVCVDLWIFILWCVCELKQSFSSKIVSSGQKEKKIIYPYPSSVILQDNKKNTTLIFNISDLPLILFSIILFWIDLSHRGINT